VEYVGHAVSATGTSFTEEKRLKVLKQKNLLQFIGLANYFKDHVPRMTEMVQPLRKLIPLKAYKGSAEAIAAFEYCQQAISNCQLACLQDLDHPITVSEATFSRSPTAGSVWCASSARLWPNCSYGG
jgi:hypothetical protein